MFLLSEVWAFRVIRTILAPRAQLNTALLEHQWGEMDTWSGQFKEQHRQWKSTFTHTQKKNKDSCFWMCKKNLSHSRGWTIEDSLEEWCRQIMHRATIHPDTQALSQARIQRMQALHGQPFRHSGLVSHTAVHHSSYDIQTGANQRHKHGNIHYWRRHNIWGGLMAQWGWIYDLLAIQT